MSADLLGLGSMSSVAAIIISIALMLFSGFFMTRLTKLLRLPDVTAYILAGILLGPYCLHLVPEDIIAGTDFLSDIALAFIAFSTGEFFKWHTLRRSMSKVVAITILEACLASVFVFVVAYCLLRLELAFSIVLAALASATAPASSLMTIRQTGARGDFVDTLLQVVALDDAVCLVEYSVAISVAVALSAGSAATFEAASVLRPIAINLGVLALGCAFGYAAKLFLARKYSSDNRLIIAIALLFAFCGVCAALDVSPLLGCMSMGTVYINTTGDDKLFKQLNYFSPPLLYFITRIAGKYAGAFLGCLAVRKRASVRNYLGLALIPQAGVAIGLAALGARTLGGEMGDALETIILASSVLYELVGPACAKLSLYLSGSYVPGQPDAPADPGVPAPAKPEPVSLVDRVRQIQETLPERNPPMSEEEAAFLAAAEEQLTGRSGANRYFHNRRRYL